MNPVGVPWHRVRPMRIVWDWNGTLFDDRAISHAVVNEVLAAWGVGTVDETHYRTRFRRPIRHYYEEVFGRPISGEEWFAIDAAFYQRYAERLTDASLARDATAALGSVQQRGWTQSILSMWLHDDLIALVGALGIEDYFTRVDGNELGNGEPKHAHLAEHVAALELAPDRCRLVGDTIDDALAARTVGIDCVLYTGGLHTAEVLAEHGRLAHTLRDALT